MNRISTCCCCTSDAYDSGCLPTVTVSSEAPRYESRNDMSVAAHLSSDAYDPECHGLPTTSAVELLFRWFTALAAPNIVAGLVRRGHCRVRRRDFLSLLIGAFVRSSDCDSENNTFLSGDNICNLPEESHSASISFVTMHLNTHDQDLARQKGQLFIHQTLSSTIQKLRWKLLRKTI